MRTRSKRRRKNNLFFFDIETNGCGGCGLSIFDQTIHRILSIAVVHGDKTFYSPVNPLMHIPTASTAIHGITNEEASKAPSLRNVWREFLKFVRRNAKDDHDVVLVAHNCFGFDKDVLQMSIAVGLRLALPSGWRFYDTLTAAREQHPGLGFGEYGLGALHERFLSTQIQGAHNALSDALALKAVFEKALSFQPERCMTANEPQTLDDNAPLSRIRGIGQVTALRIVESLHLNEGANIGDARVAVSAWDDATISMWIRTKLHQQDERYIFSIWRHLRAAYHAPAWKIYAERYPLEYHTLQGTSLSDDEASLLATKNLRSVESIRRLRIYHCAEDEHVFAKWMHEHFKATLQNVNTCYTVLRLSHTV